MQHFWRASHPYPATHAAKASVHCHSAPLSESGVRVLSVHVVARKMSELSSRLLKALLSESFHYPWITLQRPAAPRRCQRLAICPQQPNIFLTSNDDDVDQSWKQGSFPLIPSPFQIDAKRREIRWLCTRRCSFRRRERVASEELLLVIAP